MPAPAGLVLRVRQGWCASAAGRQPHSAEPRRRGRGVAHRRGRAETTGAGDRSTVLRGRDRHRDPPFAAQYARYALLTHPGRPPAAWLADWVWPIGYGLLLVAVPLRFPDGRTLAGGSLAGGRLGRCRRGGKISWAQVQIKVVVASDVADELEADIRAGTHRAFEKF